MPTLPNFNSLGKLCSSSRSQKVDHVRVKRKSSVKRMSVIEDGHVAEVLYLIPKQYMEQMPYLNPNDYYLSERLNDVATGRIRPQSPKLMISMWPCFPPFIYLCFVASVLVINTSRYYFTAGFRPEWIHLWSEMTYFFMGCRWAISGVSQPSRANVRDLPCTLLWIDEKVQPLIAVLSVVI